MNTPINVLEKLPTVLTNRQVETDPDELAQLGKDWTNGFQVQPLAAIFVESIEQVQALVAWARTHQVALVPSGGRTGLSGGAVASNGEVVVAFDRMNRIKSFNKADRLVTCEAGVVTQVLQEYAAQEGLFYPVDFASSGSSQIGGNVATNAGGIKVIRYGLTRDWVAGMRVVTGDGELLDLNAGLVKNATGYDLRHLMIGSEGTLGLICEVDIRLTALPAPQTVMVLGVPKVTDLLQVLHCFSQHVTLSAFEFFSQLALEKVMAHRELRPPLDEAVEFYALLEFDEPQMPQAEQAFATCLEQGWITDGVVSQSQQQAADLWALREGISESIAGYTPYKNDLSVQVGQIPEFLDDVDRFVKGAYPDFEVCWYGHIGDGNLHLNILRPEHLSVADFMALGHEMSPRIFELVQRRNGSISAEHGVGLLKKDFLGYSRSPAEIELMRGIKRLCDPDGILNPGKMFP